MDIALTGSQVLISFIVLATIIVALILGLKYMFGTKKNIGENYEGKTSSSALQARVKYPEVDVFRHSGTLFRLGLASALAMTVIGFSWTTYENNIDVSQYDLNVDDEIEIEPPRTAEPPPPPPPPPPPVIEEVPEEEIEEDEQPEFEDQTVEEETVFDEPPPPPKEEAPPPPPPPPPPPEPEVDEIFKVVEQMPLFGGCSDKACSDEALIRYIQGNIKYPAIARENGVEGRVFIRFVVERSGKVSDVQIVRDIGAGCGDAAKKVIEGMNTLAQGWTPGKQRGKAVRVLYTLPATFKLEG